VAATVRASYYGQASSEPAGVNAETGIKYSRDDNQATGGTPIPIPTTGGPGATNYSWIKNLALEVTVAASPATTISNRTIRLAGGAAGGLTVHWKVGAYAQPAVGNMPADNPTNNDAVPSGYTIATTSPATYDASSITGGTTGRNGSMIQVVFGVGFNFAGGPGSNTGLPNIIAGYDEA
jgi:hypothetical protein